MRPQAAKRQGVARGCVNGFGSRALDRPQWLRTYAMLEPNGSAYA